MHQAAGYAAAVSPHTYVTFRALVEAIIPYTADCSAHGAVQSAGAVQLCVHEYLIWELDHNLSLWLGYYLTPVPLAAPTAELLNCGAVQFTASGQHQVVPGRPGHTEYPFAALHPSDRIRVLAMLEQCDHLDYAAFPPPYRNDRGLVRYIIDFLNRQTMFGNYSEWPAYGSTRLRTPTERRLEGFPPGWSQVCYPGVVPGYRAIMGNVLTIERQGGGASIVRS
ncbi:hypothetical protein [Paenibacillus typhae]|uniref:hypothetical protein n=1 Tax=Paenibacillus typhae TaxID=1174501 RepID=UPI001C8D690F|nr:hypothetical protein [Paenibacillus typhae]MBY0011830.1 hypothetical protein [Paenibacillus typhae]